MEEWLESRCISLSSYHWHSGKDWPWVFWPIPVSYTPSKEAWVFSLWRELPWWCWGHRAAHFGRMPKLGGRWSRQTESRSSHCLLRFYSYYAVRGHETPLLPYASRWCQSRRQPSYPSLHTFTGIFVELEVVVLIRRLDIILMNQ